MAGHSVVIRLGAAHWDVSMHPAQGDPLHFDLRSMTKDERRQFHAQFMAAYRTTHPMYQQAPKRRRKRRSNASQLRRPRQRAH